MAAYEYLFTEELYSPVNTVIVIINQPWEELKEEDKTLLSKILNSVKLSVEKVQILAHKEVLLSQLETYSPARIIAFGCSIPDVSNLYSVYQSNEISIIRSEELNKLTDITKKSLWGALKQLFV